MDENITELCVNIASRSPVALQFSKYLGVEPLA